MLGHVRVRPDHQHPPVGDVSQRVPDLLPGDHPLVAVPHRPGGQTGQVGAGAGLAEQLAPHHLAGEGPPEQPLADLVGPVGHHGWSRHGPPEELAGPRRRGPGLDQPVVHLPLQVGGRAVTSVALGERYPCQPHVELSGPERLHRNRPGVHLLEQLAGQVADQGPVDSHATEHTAQARTGTRNPEPGTRSIDQGCRRPMLHPSPAGR